MSSKPSSIPTASGPGGVAPTPQNTPLNAAPIASAMSKPTVPTIGEDTEEGGPPDTPPGQTGGTAFAGLGKSIERSVVSGDANGVDW